MPIVRAEGWAFLPLRSLPEWRSQYLHLATRRGRKIAKVAIARRLATPCAADLRRITLIG